MRVHSAITSLTELVLIAVMGAIGAYAFLASSAYETVKSFGAAHNIGFMAYLPLIIWLFITGFGMLNIVGFKRSAGSFTWLVVIFSLPSLLAHNAVDWWGMIGLGGKLTTTLSFTTVLALGVLIMTGYVILDYLRFFKDAENSLARRRADWRDIEEVNGFSNLSLLGAVGGTLAATALVAFLARGLETLALGLVKKMPWNAVFVGLACLLLVAFYLYWLSARRGKGDGEENTTNNTNIK